MMFVSSWVVDMSLERRGVIICVATLLLHYCDDVKKYCKTFLKRVSMEFLAHSSSYNLPLRMGVESIPSHPISLILIRRLKVPL